ncbi:MAG: hypothetical protein HRT80_01010 [Henriciella sp.]|nr:hypothetical protein [Henriciella sp.]
MSLKFSHSQFFEAGPHCDAFDTLLFQATSRKSVLSLTLGASDAEISLSEAANVSAARIGLAELSQIVLDQRTPNAAQVLYPLLGRVTSIDLPAGSIFALRSHNRSMADFWARNLFHALSSTHNVEYVQKFDGRAGDGPTTVEEFTKRYLWVLRDALPDSNLKRADLLEQLMIDFHFPVIAYENEVFKGGMKALRRINAATLDDQRMSAEDVAASKRFNNTRSNLLALLVE